EYLVVFFFQAEDGIVDFHVSGVQTCALPIYLSWRGRHLWAQLGRMFVGWLLALAIVASIAVLFKVAENYSRIWLVSTLAVALGFVTVFRIAVFLFLRNLRLRGPNLSSERAT